MTSLSNAVRPYLARGPLAAFFLGVSSAFPYAMIGATLTSRLAQSGVDRKGVTAFALVFLAYNLKWAWAWIVDAVKVPLLGRLGQRVSWLLLTGALAIVAVINLALVDPAADLMHTVYAAVFVGIAGATYDIVIDSYRIEQLEPHQLGPGAGMSQYGWRIGAASAAWVALHVASSFGWQNAYLATVVFALPAMVTGLLLGEPTRHRPPAARRTIKDVLATISGPLAEFFQRKGALLVLLFILLHKIGDTLSNLTFRLLFNDLKYTNEEIANIDVGFGFVATLVGIYVGGLVYSALGMKRSVLVSLFLMAISNFSFALLAAIGHSNVGLAAAIGFENFASGLGGVTVVAYFSALCDLRFTASQYALISAASSVVGRILTGTTAGWLIEKLGYVGFYLFTTIIAFPGIILFWLMMRAKLLDASMGTAGKISSKEA